MSQRLATVPGVSRAPRHPSPTGLYHVTSRAIRPLQLFTDAADCSLFCHALARVHREEGIGIVAYCLMGTHFHLIARAEPDVLSRSMRRLKSWHARALNDRHERAGPVFDNRYSAIPLATEAHIAGAIVYIAVNPVRAGLAEHADEWPYGSHRAHAALDDRPRWLAPAAELPIYSDSASYRDAVDYAVRQIHRGACRELSASPATSPTFVKTRSGQEA